ncbi:DMT family transporter, partial [Candidatus Peregrinibacteria bacterium]|nr:DMT family transporter [Candidatus Peregrinibacteria bacterium]
ALYSLFPLIINKSSKSKDHIIFAGVSIFLAGVYFFFHLLFTKQFKALINKQTLLYSLGVTIFIIILPALFIFNGTKYTTGINTTIFLQTEILAAFIICGAFLKEKITPKKILGSALIILGASTVLYNGEFKLNFGDLMIIAGASIYPIGNIFAKKALQTSPPEVILFIRSILGGLVLIALSVIFEKSLSHQPVNQIINNYPYIIANGIIIFAISKMLWYRGLKLLDVSKATTLSMSYPAISLLLAVIFLKERPTIYQLLGLIIIMSGIYLTVHKSKKLSEIAEISP